MHTANSRSSFWFTAACFALYVGVIGVCLLSDLATRPIWTDEAFSYHQVAGRSFPDMLKSFEGGVNAMPYAYFIILWSIDQLFGLGPLGLRLPSALFGIAGLFLLHKMLSRWFGGALAFVACVAALLLSKEFILYTHEARPYTLYFLAAVLCLCSCLWIVRTDGLEVRALIGNAFVAFAFPGAHYVGLLYSAAAAVALAYALRDRGSRTLLRVAGSFAAGWIAFLAVQYSQILLFLRKQGAIDPAWIPRPQPYEVFDLARETAALLPSPIPLLVALFAGFALWRGKAHALSLPDDDRRPAMRFLLVVAALWVAMPPLFLLCGAIGLPNLTLVRYFTPTLVAPAIFSVFALHAFYPRPAPEVAPVSRDAKFQFDTVGVAVVLLFTAYPALVAVKDAAKAPHRFSQRAIEVDYAHIASSPLPCVTNNIHVFFQYNYYRGGRQELALLRKTRREVEAYERFDHTLPVKMATELARLPKFLFVHQEGTANSYPEFDINVWARSNGYAIVDLGERGVTRAYEVSRSGG